MAAGHPGLASKAEAHQRGGTRLRHQLKIDKNEVIADYAVVGRSRP